MSTPTFAGEPTRWRFAGVTGPGVIPDYLASFKYFDYCGIVEQQDVVKALAALAQGSRMQVFRSLVVAGPPGLTPGALAEWLKLPPATLSFQLKELMNAGLVSQQRNGRHLIYRADFGRMNELLTYLTAHCCQGQACLVPTATALSCDC